VDSPRPPQANGIPFIYHRIVSSRKPIMVILRSSLFIMLTILAVKNLYISLDSLFSPRIYMKDFAQEFLLVKAAWSGLDPYLPMPELANRVMRSVPGPGMDFPHPIPHPPPVALLFFPLGWLTYTQAAKVWFFFELACITLSVFLLLRWLGVRKRSTFALLGASLPWVWRPFTEELILGQLNAFLLVLLIAAWQELRSNKEIQGGIFLGLAVAIKLVAWPIVVFLMIQRNWRAALSALATTVVANMTASLLMGFDRVAYYYLKVGPSVSSLYHARSNNFSLWSLGWKLFEGTGTPILGGVTAPPLINAPSIAPYVSTSLVMALLIVSLLLTFRARNFDTSFGILICLLILISPVAWGIYLLPALIPLAIVGRSLSFLDWPKKETFITFGLGSALFIPTNTLGRLMLSLSGGEIQSDGRLLVPFAVALLGLWPAMALLGLLWFVWRLDRLTPPGALSTAGVGPLPSPSGL
jgi:Glycosyltransferase family 87